jgi:hypothetical protein
MKKYLIMITAVLMGCFSMVRADDSVGVILYTYDDNNEVMFLMRSRFDKNYGSFVASEFGGYTAPKKTVYDNAASSAAKIFNELSFYYVARLFDRLFFNQESLRYSQLYANGKESWSAKSRANLVIQNRLEQFPVYLDKKFWDGKAYGTQRLFFLYLPKACFFHENELSRQFFYLSTHYFGKANKVKLQKNVRYHWIYPFKLKEQNGNFFAEHAIVGDVKCTDKFIRLRKSFYNTLNDPSLKSLVVESKKFYRPHKSSLFKEKWFKNRLKQLPRASNTLCTKFDQISLSKGEIDEGKILDNLITEKLFKKPLLKPLVSNEKSKDVCTNFEPISLPNGEMDGSRILANLINEAKKAAIEALAEGNFVKVGEYTQKLYNLRTLHEFVLQNASKK